jgi:flagellar secretion chaperone FliS
MSSRANPVSAYKETSIRTASGGKIVVMLYDEAIKQLERATDLMDSQTRQLDLVNNAILKAQDILTELMVSLDFENGGDIATNLFRLYRYFSEQLIEANVQKEPEPIRHVCNHLVELRNAWAQIMNKAQVQGGPTRGVNIAG